MGFRDRIKGLKLRRINAYCSTAAVHKILFYHLCTAARVLRPKQYTSRSTRGIKKYLKVPLPQYTSRSTQDIFFFLVYCGSCTVAAAVEPAPAAAACRGR